MPNRKMLTLFLLFFVTPAFAADQPALETEKDRISYSIGYQVGGDFRRQKLEIRTEPLLKGLSDALSGSEPSLTSAQMQAAMQELQRIASVQQQKEMEEAGETNLLLGRSFLAENRQKEGVTTLPSGLQYKVVQAGSGKKPGRTDSVTVNYRGRLIDGTEFDSSYARNQPATFRVDQVIRGWTEALQLMEEGAKWELYIPADLAYGKAAAGPKIGPNSTLIFEVELLSVKSSE